MAIMEPTVIDVNARTGMVSADGHAIEPPDLWVERLPRELQDAAPRVEYIESEQVLIVNGERRTLPGLNLDFPENHPDALDPARRAEVLASQGVAAEVLYPQWSMLLYGLDDSQLQTAVLRAYNEWLAEFAAAAPGHFIGVGLLPVHDVGAAIEGLAHAVEIGLPGVALPSKRKDLAFNDDRFEPLWDAIEASTLPLSLHVAPTLVHWGKGAIGANIVNNLSPFRGIFPIFVFSGILERHPGLRLVLTEGGISWVASTLYDMDLVYERFNSFLRPRLEAAPSEIWRRQCYATFQDDPVGLATIDRIGVQNVLWAADYPHPEGTYPRTQQIVSEQFAHLPDADTAAIVGGNARSLWRV